MPNVENHEFLSFGDALFLYLERDETPLNIASVGVFDGPIELDDLICYVESKLPKIPRYLQRVVIPPLNVGSPSWEYDPEFKIENHIRELTLALGTEAELKDVAGDILSTTLDRRHPLWDLTVVHGLKGGKTAVITRAHHCMADGLSGVALLNTLMDPSPAVPKLQRRRHKSDAPQQRDSFTVFADGLLQSYFSIVQRTLMACSDMLKMAQRAVDTGEKSAGSDALQATPKTMADEIEKVTRMIPELLQPVERLPFNTLCQGPQKFRWEHIPLPAIKAVKNAAGTTVNDVVLAVLASTFREYVKLHGTDLKGRSLRIVVPVSVRNGAEEQMGNHITFVPVSAPLDIDDPGELLAEIHRRMELLKTTRAPELAVFSGTLLGLIPSPLQAVIAPILSRLPISLCNVIFTNVPGPQFPLYLLGRKMLCAYPYVPIGGEMGINCAVLTYDSNAFFGFTGDAGAAPDLARLEGFLQKGFKALQASVGIRERKRGAPKVVRRRTKNPPTRRRAAEAKREHPLKAETVDTKRAEVTLEGQEIEMEPALA